MGDFWITDEYDLCISTNYGWIWFMSKYELLVNFWRIHHKHDGGGGTAAARGQARFLIGWLMSKYELWVNMIYVQIWIMGEYESWVNMFYV